MIKVSYQFKSKTKPTLAIDAEYNYNVSSNVRRNHGSIPSQVRSQNPWKHWRKLRRNPSKLEGKSMDSKHLIYACHRLVSLFGVTMTTSRLRTTMTAPAGSEGNRSDSYWSQTIICFGQKTHWHSPSRNVTNYSWKGLADYCFVLEPLQAAPQRLMSMTSNSAAKCLSYLKLLRQARSYWGKQQASL